MFEHGESSRAREVDTRDIITDVITVSYATIPGYEMPPILRDDTPEEQRGDYRDIQLDTIQPRMAEPHTGMEREVREDPTAVPTEADSDDEYRGRSSTPIRGGVTRFGGYTDSEDDEADDDDRADDDGYDASSEPDGDDDEAEVVPESDPEEAPMEEEPIQHDPVGYVDGMGSTVDDIIESSTARIVELEEQVQHLEEQNAVHQHTEDQFRDVAYQREAEATELRQMQGELIRQLEQQVTRSDQLRAERDAARAELQMVRGELVMETAIREFAQEAWIRATDRVTELEGQVRDRTARIDTALFTFDTAMGRVRSRIRQYPRDEDMSRRTIDRRVVDHMIYQEHRDAVRRVTRD